MVWFYLPAAFLLLTPFAVWRMRKDYRRHGRLTWLCFGLMNVWFFLPHLAVDYAVRYRTPWTFRQYAGLGVSLLGIAVLLAAMLSFRSAKKVLARDPGTLTVSGPYRWSRNPQYVGWLLFVLGFMVIGWTWRCWISLAMFVPALYALVLAEEEHLRRAFGDDYRDYCARVPRWLGRPNRDDSAGP